MPTILFAPIILFFGNPTETEENTVKHTQVDFDITSSKSKDRIDWIYGKRTALLAHDINNNGLIDDASELFNEVVNPLNPTINPNQPSETISLGFQTLSKYDKSGKGYIDLNDEVYHKLFLWFDVNGDGISQANELKKLSLFKITKIATKYLDVNPNNTAQIQFANSNPLNQFSIAEARFFGPLLCGSFGCKSYAINLAH